MFEDNKQFWEEFIALYRDLPCLWALKTKEYNNPDLKAKAYEKLVEKCKTVKPDADKAYVIKKIKSLRASFRRQLKKLRRAPLGGGEVPEPTLWYFELLMFTADQEGSQLGTFSNQGRETSDDGSRSSEEEDWNSLQNHSLLRRRGIEPLGNRNQSDVTENLPKKTQGPKPIESLMQFANQPMETLDLSTNQPTGYSNHSTNQPAGSLNHSTHHPMGSSNRSTKQPTGYLNHRVNCSAESSYWKRPSSKQRSLAQKRMDIVDTVSQYLEEYDSTQENDCSAFGKSVGLELEIVTDPEQRDVAKKLISEVLFMAKRKRLTFNSRVDVDPGRTNYNNQDQPMLTNSTFNCCPTSYAQ